MGRRCPRKRRQNRVTCSPPQHAIAEACLLARFFHNRSVAGLIPKCQQHGWSQRNQKRDRVELRQASEEHVHEAPAVRVRHSSILQEETAVRNPGRFSGDARHELNARLVWDQFADRYAAEKSTMGTSMILTKKGRIADAFAPSRLAPITLGVRLAGWAIPSLSNDQLESRMIAARALRAPDA
jgi:hypothetical protein